MQTTGLEFRLKVHSRMPQMFLRAGKFLWGAELQQLLGGVACSNLQESSGAYAQSQQLLALRDVRPEFVLNKVRR